MKEPIRITPPLTVAVLEKLKIGDQVLISGDIYTARDAAHLCLVKHIANKEPLPFDIKGQIIYYVGPSPAKPGKAVGAAGPTTSYRMDAYTPELLAQGLKGMLGKGVRNPSVKEALQKYKAVYFAAIGGAGALLSQRIISAEIIAYPELGPEAVRRLSVKDFPAFVVNDVYGGDLYEAGVANYAR